MMTTLQERLRELYVQNGTNYVQQAADRIDALEAELAALKAQEPVAWQSLRADGSWGDATKWTPPNHTLKNYRPLYAAPVPAQYVNAELVEFVEEVRRTGDTRLANMAIAALAKVKESK